MYYLYVSYGYTHYVNYVIPSETIARKEFGRIKRARCVDPKITGIVLSKKDLKGKIYVLELDVNAEALCFMSIMKCVVCGDEFEPYRRTNKYCSKQCFHKADYKNRKTRGYKQARTDEQKVRITAYAKRWNKENSHVQFVRRSKRSDAEKGYENNLTVEFVEAQFDEPCSYCGTTEIPPSLDRIDNDKGHTLDNVVPCCARCNYIRRDIPYAAWLLMVPGLKEAHEKGFLSNYNTFCKFRGLMFQRKRGLKSNTKCLTIKDLDFEQVKKFLDLMSRTGKTDNKSAMQVIIDLLDEDLPKITVDYKKEGKIPQHVIEYRKSIGLGDGNFDIKLEEDK